MKDNSIIANQKTGVIFVDLNQRISLNPSQHPPHLKFDYFILTFVLNQFYHSMKLYISSSAYADNHC